MRESAIHVHNLDDIPHPIAANDAAPEDVVHPEALNIKPKEAIGHPLAANDNFLAEANDNESAEELLRTRERLGLTDNAVPEGEPTIEKPIVADDVKAMESTPPTVEAAVLEEVPQLTPERIRELQEATAQMELGHAETAQGAVGPAIAAQAAGGALRMETDGNAGAGAAGPASGRFGFLGKALKGIFKSAAFIVGALFALGMAALVKSTNMILDKSGATKGGGGKPKSGGGSHGGAAHP